MWSLVFTGNWLALILLIVLFVMSIGSWAIIVTKWLQFRAAVAENRHFYSVFLRDQPLSNLFSLAQKFPSSPLARMFDVSYREINAFRNQVDKDLADHEARKRLMQNLTRSLERVYNQQNLQLERRLPFLAVVSSSAPYIGLFGTVWGIMNAFRGLSDRKSTRLNSSHIPLSRMPSSA